MKKLLVFDMDGTIADLYKVENWLGKLRVFDESPYEQAAPIYSMKEINELIQELKEVGYEICVTSWLSKESNREYDRKVRQAKREWLKNQGFEYDYIHLVKYGTKKHYVTRKFKYEEQILIDDNDEVRNEWDLGATIDPRINLISSLKNLL